MTQALLLCFVAGSWAHMLPIHAVTAEMKIDGDAARISFETDAAMPIEDLFGEVPPGPWSAERLAQAKTFIDEHFILEADGERLDSRIIEARYLREGWAKAKDINAYGYAGIFRFEVGYWLPSGAKELSGRARFFRHDYENLTRNNIESIYHTEFLTRLRVYGAPARTIVLPYERPDFKFGVAAARRPAWRRWHEAASWAFAAEPWATAALWVLTALLSGRRPWRLWASLPLWLLAVLTGYVGACCGIPGAEAVGWGAAVLMGCGTLLTAGGPRWTWISTAAAALWGLSLSAPYAVVRDLPLGHDESRVAFFVGALASAAVVVVCGAWALRLYRRSLVRVSAQSGERLFAAHSRFAAAACAALGAYQAFLAL